MGESAPCEIGGWGKQSHFRCLHAGESGCVVMARRTKTKKNKKKRVHHTHIETKHTLATIERRKKFPRKVAFPGPTTTFSAVTR